MGHLFGSVCVNMAIRERKFLSQKAALSLSLSFSLSLSLSFSLSLPKVFEDAQESPLEKRISDSIAATKDNKDNGIFSLVPSRVATFPSCSQGSSGAQTDPISNPDSFSDLFRLLGECVGVWV